MIPHPLDNPMWAALTGRQRWVALGDGRVRRYLPDVAPFLAFADASVDAAKEIDDLVARGESVYVVGVAPHHWPTGWRVLATGNILQMLCTRVPVPDDAPSSDAATIGRWAPLAVRDRPAMLALTAQVYPEFFRERTDELGRYVGIWRGDTLAAMAGERLETEGHVEISAVCTHPDFLGRGYAAQLMAVLANEIAARGATPFLHVGDHNQRAIDLYLRLGFVERARLALWKLRREA